MDSYRPNRGYAMNHLKQNALAAAFVVGATFSSLTSAAPMSYPGAGGALPDLVAFSSDVTVFDTGTITNVSVSLNDFSHSWIGDLVATLVFDDGSNPAITASLFGAGTVGFGPSNDAEGDYVFADGGAAAFQTAGNPIPSGTYAPQDSLAAFGGLSAAGTWTLNLTDRSGGDSGNLGSWTLNIDMEEVAAPVPAPATLALFGLGLVGLGWSRRRKSNG
ncbi:unnamed protein product [Laminaria digitata]